jgi:hypothetical protein
MSNQQYHDEKFYQAAPSGSLGDRVAIAARNQIYQAFLQRCSPSPSDRILDVGVSDVMTGAANVLERCYPHQEAIVAAGLGEGEDFRRAFPRVEYVRIEPGAPLPFADRAFRFAVSNAVLEHVGSVGEQRRFVRELMRVANEVFITVPNRFFPVEHHTAIPVAHFWDASFHTACKALNKDDWTRPENLILMSRKRLNALVPAEAGASTVGYTGLRLGPFSSNLYLHAQGARTVADGGGRAQREQDGEQRRQPHQAGPIPAMHLAGEPDERRVPEPNHEEQRRRPPEIGPSPR